MNKKSALFSMISRYGRILGAVLLFGTLPLSLYGEGTKRISNFHNAGTDDDIDAIFMTLKMNSGASETIMLSNDNEWTGPVFHPAEKTITINGTHYYTEDVNTIRFALRQVDGIQDVTADEGIPADAVIYNLQGQKVHVGASMGSLPKGIYIINGKKRIVR